MVDPSSSSAMLVHNQLVCLPTVEVFNLLVCICIIVSGYLSGGLAYWYGLAKSTSTINTALTFFASIEEKLCF